MPFTFDQSREQKFNDFAIEHLKKLTAMAVQLFLSNARAQEELSTPAHKDAEIEVDEKYGPEKTAKFMGLGGVALGLVLGMSKKTSKSMDSLMAKPLNRGLVMQVAAILGFVSGGQVKRDLKVLDQNKNYVEKLLKDFKGKTPDTVVDTEVALTETAAAGANGLSINSNSIPRKNDGKELVTEILGIPCPGGMDEETGECLDIDALEVVKESASITDLGGINGGILDTLKGLTGATNEVFKGNLEKATELIGEFGTAKNAASLNNNIKKVQETLNNQLTAEGKTPINFSEGVKSVSNHLDDLIKAEARKAPGGLASLFPNQRKGGESKFLPAENQGVKRRFASRRKLPFKKRKNFRRGGSSKGSNTLFFGSFKSKPGQTKSEKEFGKYKTDLNDINKKKELSIFRVISSRYIRSGFKRLLEKKN